MVKVTRKEAAARLNVSKSTLGRPEDHPLEIQHQVPAAGVLIEARLMPIVEVPPQRRSLAGRLLGTVGRIFKPGAGRCKRRS